MIRRREREQSRWLRTSLLGVAWLSVAIGGVRADPASVAPEDGPCPVSSGSPCAITLAGSPGPSLSAECTSAEWSKLLGFPQPQRFTDSNGDGTWESVVEIRLDPARDCGCARFRLFFTDELSGWMVHIGESPTNNGHGGDEGTSANAAEVHLLDRMLTVYSSAQSDRRKIDRLLEVGMPPLEGRVLEFEICDQSLDIDLVPTLSDPNPPRWELETLNSKLLFSLVDAGGATARSDASVYAGFNRVIHRLKGEPSHGRVGSGVRRVEIYLTP